MHPSKSEYTRSEDSLTGPCCGGTEKEDTQKVFRPLDSSHALEYTEKLEEGEKGGSCPGFPFLSTFLWAYLLTRIRILDSRTDITILNSPEETDVIPAI